MRAYCPDAAPGPLLMPSTGGEVADEGVDGDVAWMRVGGASPGSGGIAAAAHEVNWKWVSEHSGHHENERVDAAARDAIVQSRNNPGR